MTFYYNGTESRFGNHPSHISGNSIRHRLKGAPHRLNDLPTTVTAQMSQWENHQGLHRLTGWARVTHNSSYASYVNDNCDSIGKLPSSITDTMIEWNYPGQSFGAIKHIGDFYGACPNIVTYDDKCIWQAGHLYRSHQCSASGYPYPNVTTDECYGPNFTFPDRDFTKGLPILVQGRIDNSPHTRLPTFAYENGTLEWYCENQLSRYTGPAVISPEMCAFYINGNRCRSLEEGPAGIEFERCATYEESDEYWHSIPCVVCPNAVVYFVDNCVYAASPNLYGKNHPALQPVKLTKDYEVAPDNVNVPMLQIPLHSSPYSPRSPEYEDFPFFVENSLVLDRFSAWTMPLLGNYCFAHGKIRHFLKSSPFSSIDRRTGEMECEDDGYEPDNDDSELDTDDSDAYDGYEADNDHDEYDHEKDFHPFSNQTDDFDDECELRYLNLLSMYEAYSNFNAEKHIAYVKDHSL
jgi:hypothetical protein